MLAFVVCLAVVFAAAFFGAQFQIGDWYAGLAKPSWTPPNAVFGPVWTGLYVLMGVAAALVWRQVGFGAAWKPLAVFAVQLVLNAAWSWLFFGLHRPGSAFAEIVAMWAAILITLVLFWRVRPLAGILFLPYLLWVSFAGVLNFSIWQLNR